MKTLNRIFLAATAAASFVLVSQALADDGIAASPKVRQSLNERKASLDATTISSAESAPGANLTASPKTRQMFASQAVSSVASSGETMLSQNPDGIAASPKVRAQLNERPMEFQVAPLK